MNSAHTPNTSGPECFGPYLKVLKGDGVHAQQDSDPCDMLCFGSRQLGKHVIMHSDKWEDNKSSRRSQSGLHLGLVDKTNAWLKDFIGIPEAMFACTFKLVARSGGGWPVTKPFLKVFQHFVNKHAITLLCNCDHSRVDRQNAFKLGHSDVGCPKAFGMTVDRTVQRS